MKKGLLFSFLLAGSFLLYDNDAFAGESGNSTDQTLRPTENIIYFNSDKQDILATNDIIIRTISPIISNFYTVTNKYKEGSNSSILGAGTWDTLGGQYVYAKSKVWASHGGDYLVEVGQEDYGPVFYQLKEQDPSFDDNVGDTIHITSSKIVSITYRNISNWCDGDNNLAEFYMGKLTHTGTPYYMAFYD